MLRKGTFVLILACLASIAAGVLDEPEAHAKVAEAIGSEPDLAHGTSKQYVDIVDPYTKQPRADRGCRRARAKYVRGPTVPRKQIVPTHANTPGIDKYESLLRYRNGVRAYKESLHTAGLAKRPVHWPENRSEKEHGFLNTYDRARFGDPNAQYMVWSRASMRWEPNIEGITNHEFIARRKQAMRQYSARRRQERIAEERNKRAQSIRKLSETRSESADVPPSTTSISGSPSSAQIYRGPNQSPRHDFGLQPSPSPSQDASHCYGFYGCIDSPMGPVFSSSPSEASPYPQVPMTLWRDFPYR